jgi:hypothetical protein
MSRNYILDTTRIPQGYAGYHIEIKTGNNLHNPLLPIKDEKNVNTNKG